jgi:ferredoxin
MARIVAVNTDDCIGCGTCEGQCPADFRLDEEAGKSTVIMPRGGPEDCIEQAIVSCPVGAIHWEG